MATRISKRTNEPYQTYECRSKVVEGITYREAKHVKEHDIINRYPRPSRSRKDVVNVVTQRITSAADGHNSAELELASFDCPCEQFFYEYQRSGPMATCSHIVDVMNEQRLEREQTYRQMVERKLITRAQMGDMNAARALATMADLFEGDELIKWAGC